MKSLYRKTLPLLLFINFLLLSIVNINCSPLCDPHTHISSGTDRIEKGAPCIDDCDCNNQLYEGKCVEKEPGKKQCLVLKRESCDELGKSRSCHTPWLTQCKQGIQYCGIRLELNRYNNCTCPNNTEPTTKEKTHQTEQITDSGPSDSPSSEALPDSSPSSPEPLPDTSPTHPESLPEKTILERPSKDKYICNHQCSAGQTQCNNGQIRSCTTDNHGCRVWSPFKNCPDGFCASPAACGSCNHQCSAGQAQCNNGQLRSCTTDNHGCRIWSPYKYCPDGFCASPAACGSCNHQCSAGQTQCNNGQIRSCTTDNHGCRVWGPYKNCPSGSICMQNKCVPQNNCFKKDSHTLALWQFDGNLKDETGGFNATMNKPIQSSQWVQGICGKALNFKQNYFSNFKFINPSPTSFSIEVRVRLNNRGSHSIIAGHERRSALTLMVHPHGLIEYNFTVAGTQYKVNSKTALTPNIWYHLRATYSQLTGKMELYINRKLDNTNTISIPSFRLPKGGSSEPIIVGAYISCVGSNCNYANYLDGAISALKISATYPSSP